jgi:hypothetical protein
MAYLPGGRQAAEGTGSGAEGGQSRNRTVPAGACPLLDFLAAHASPASGQSSRSASQISAAPTRS